MQRIVYPFLRLLLIVSFIFFQSQETKCQKAIEIEYKRQLLNYTDSGSFREQTSRDQEFNIRMVFNDSFALTYYYNKFINKQPGKTKIGDKLIHHGNFFNFITGERMEEVNWSKKEKDLIKLDTVVSWNWQFFDEKRKILGKTCLSALSVNKKMIAYLYSILPT